MMMTEGVRLSAWWRLRVILFECYLTFRIWNPGSKEYLDHAEQPGGLTKLREPVVSRSEAQIWPATFTNGSDTENWT